MFGPRGADEDPHERCRAHELTLREIADDWRTMYQDLLQRFERYQDTAIARETELLNRLGAIPMPIPRAVRDPRDAPTSPAPSMPLVARAVSPAPGPRPMPRATLTPRASGFRPGMPMPRPPAPRPDATTAERQRAILDAATADGATITEGAAGAALADTENQ